MRGGPRVEEVRDRVLLHEDRPEAVEVPDLVGEVGAFGQAGDEEVHGSTLGRQRPVRSRAERRDGLVHGHLSPNEVDGAADSGAR